MRFKKYMPKNSSCKKIHSRKGNFLAPSFKNFLHSRRNFQSPKNQNILRFSKNRFLTVFIFSINWIKQYYWNIKTFFSAESFFSFWTFFITYKFTIKICFYRIANFFPNCHIFVKKFPSFMIKYIYLLLSKYLLCVLISRKNMHKGLISLLSL